MKEHVKKYIEENELFKPNDRLLVAVSGGVDSVVLAQLIHSLGYSFAIAHVNYGLRGKDSDEDALFVKKLGKELGVDVWVREAKPNLKQEKGIQEKARAIRYLWFEELCREKGFDCVLTAHHKDDSVETVLMNFFRGTGTAGMRGIPARRELFRRPLLSCSKLEILRFAEKNQYHWREDRTNLETDYNRNYVRNTLLPAIAERWPQVRDTVAQHSFLMQEVDQISQLWLKKKLKEVVFQKDSIKKIERVKIVNSPAPHTLLRAALKPHSFSFQTLAKILKGENPGSEWYSNDGQLRLVLEPSGMLLAQHQSAARSFQPLPVEEKAGEMVTPFGTFSLDFSEHFPRKLDIHSAVIPMNKLRFPLRLRKWKAGDIFQPGGMKGRHKKVKSFLTDLKLGKIEKEKTLVLLNGEEMVWVVGYRIDERYLHDVDDKDTGPFCIFQWKKH